MDNLTTFPGVIMREHLVRGYVWNPKDWHEVIRPLYLVRSIESVLDCESVVAVLLRVATVSSLQAKNLMHSSSLYLETSEGGMRTGRGGKVVTVSNMPGGLEYLYDFIVSLCPGIVVLGDRMFCI